MRKLKKIMLDVDSRLGHNFTSCPSVVFTVSLANLGVY